MRSNTSYLFVTFCVFLAGCGDERKSSADSLPQLVRGLDIEGIALYQSVKVPIMEQGQEVTSRPVPVINGKDSILRIFVTRQPEWRARKVSARVEVESLLADLEPLEVEIHVDFDSTDENLETTLNIDIPGKYMLIDSGFSVSLYEVEDEDGDDGESEIEIAGNSDSAVWPLEGKAAFGGDDAGGPLKIVLVPVRYNADGSGRLPDTSEEQLKLFRDRFYTIYPVDEVDVGVVDPIDWDTALTAMGVGWDQLLSRIQTLRNDLGADPKEYYYGIFTPADTFAAFCGMGCVTGLSYLVTSATASGMRAGIGIGYNGIISVDTSIHEMGHLHGREHSPCGLGGQPSDPNFPSDAAHQEADIGVWGLDVINMALKSPSEVKDFMSYCQPIWASDYTYAGLFERVQAVNALQSMHQAPRLDDRWLSVSIGLDGALHRGPELSSLDFSREEQTQVELLDASGQVVETVDGFFNPYGDRNGGLVVFPEPSEDVAFMRLPGRQPVAI
jgi:hypothetical protein